MTDENTIDELSQALVSELLSANKRVSTAESCSGGWIAKAITDVAGSSACFGYGIVSYSNGAKESMLGVSPAILEQHGAVSEQTVIEMAEGCINLSGADYAVAVSGIAGPDGGSDEKPVGTVWFAWAVRSAGEIMTSAKMRTFEGDREQVRRQTVVVALQGLRVRLREDE
jgi:nicotinamide-nucleotide amidase